MTTQPVAAHVVPEVYRSNEYTIRRKVFTVLGAAFYIHDPAGQVVGYSKQKAFKLREDIRVYADESRTAERLVIQARQVIDFSASYDVVDAQAMEPVGTLRRRGLKSILRDEWVMLDAAGRQIGMIQEDSAAMAMVRRFVPYGSLVPQSFHVTVAGQPVAAYRQHFNPFVLKLSVTIEPAADQVADRRLLLAAGILLAAIEGRQSN